MFHFFKTKNLWISRELNIVVDCLSVCFVLVFFVVIVVVDAVFVVVVVLDVNTAFSLFVGPVSVSKISV
jgi:hypothetical protein